MWDEFLIPPEVLAELYRRAEEERERREALRQLEREERQRGD